MQDEFSWMQIHPEGNKYSLYLYNKTGLVKRVFSNPSLDVVQNAMKRRQELNNKISKALAEAIQTLKTNPDAVKRLREFHDGRKAK